MPYFFFGLIALLLLLLLAKGFVSANPTVLADVIRKVGGAVGLLIAGVFLVTGRWFLAIPVGAFAFGLLTGRRIPGFPGGFGGGGARSAGQTSTVRSVYVEMNLDHDTGLMNGRVLAGEFEGALLSDLSLEDLLTMRRECSADPQSVALLEAYLDRHHGDWRDAFDGDAGSGPSGEGPVASGPLTRDEAYAILGLSPGASETDIRAAHRALMKRFHPDQGGSDYLASKVNEAKDLLLGQ